MGAKGAAEIAVMGAKGAAEIIFKNEISAAANKDEKWKEKVYLSLSKKRKQMC
jgi:propionyl-CoA carboxylase beta chain